MRESMISNEEFLELSKKVISEPLNNTTLENFFNVVEKFQEQRLERLADTKLENNTLFAQYLSPALNEMMENQNSKQARFMFESTAQHYTNSILIALKNKMQQEEKSVPESQKEDFLTLKTQSNESIEKLLNHEKKNGHKFHNVIHDYVKDSQEFLYDHEKLALRGRSMPSIADRAKEIAKNKDDKKFNMQELEHPKLEAQQFERDMKSVLKGDISEHQVVSALKRVEEFQLGFINSLKKKIDNPTGSAEKLIATIPELAQVKALKDWAWQEESVNVMAKILKLVQKSGVSLEHTNYEALHAVTEKLDSVMLDIGSLKKYNKEVKQNLLENIQALTPEVKTTSTMKM